MRHAPRRFENAKYEDVPANIREKFDKILETRRGMYIFGPVGTGKTHISFALKAHRDKSSKFLCAFWNTTELMQEIKSDFDRQGIDKSWVYEKMMEEREILFLDDIGSEKLTDWVLERFYLIINRKYNEQLPIIFTSNYSIEELAERLGDRIASRIVEMCDIIKIDGEDRRLK